MTSPPLPLTSPLSHLPAHFPRVYRTRTTPRLHHTENIPMPNSTRPERFYALVSTTIPARSGNVPSSGMARMLTPEEFDIDDIRPSEVKGDEFVIYSYADMNLDCGDVVEVRRLFGLPFVESVICPA